MRIPCVCEPPGGKTRGRNGLPDSYLMVANKEGESKRFLWQCALGEKEFAGGTPALLSALHRAALFAGNVGWALHPGFSADGADPLALLVEGALLLSHFHSAGLAVHDRQLSSFILLTSSFLLPLSSFILIPASASACARRRRASPPRDHRRVCRGSSRWVGNSGISGRRAWWRRDGRG